MSFSYEESQETSDVISVKRPYLGYHFLSMKLFNRKKKAEKKTRVVEVERKRGARKLSSGEDVSEKSDRRSNKWWKVADRASHASTPLGKSQKSSSIRGSHSIEFLKTKNRDITSRASHSIEFLQAKSQDITSRAKHSIDFTRSAKDSLSQSLDGSAGSHGRDDDNRHADGSGRAGADGSGRTSGRRRPGGSHVKEYVPKRDRNKAAHSKDQSAEGEAANFIAGAPVISDFVAAKKRDDSKTTIIKVILVFSIGLLALIFVSRCAISPSPADYDSMDGAQPEAFQQADTGMFLSEDSTSAADVMYNTQKTYLETANVTGNIKELLQNPEFPSGCEEVSLTCVLNAYGIDVSAKEIIDEYLPIDSSGEDYVYHYVGSPYEDGLCFAPAIVTTANAYFEAKSIAAQAVELKGVSFDELMNKVNSGQPILVWSTMYFEEPWTSDISYNDYDFYNNEHCVVLYGVDGSDALVSDPLEGLIRRDLETFRLYYEECGSMAVEINPESPWSNAETQGSATATA